MSSSVEEVPSDWQPIPGHPAYFATADGKIFHGGGHRIPLCEGSEHLQLRIGGDRNKKICMRRDFLVCSAFRGPRPESSPAFPEHIDGSSSCASGNLRWATGWLPIPNFNGYWLRPDNQIVFCGASAKSGGKPVRQFKWHGATDTLYAALMSEGTLTMRRVCDLVAATRSGSPLLSEGIRAAERAAREQYRAKHHRTDFRTYPERTETEVNALKDMDQVFYHTKHFLEASAERFGSNYAAVFDKLLELWFDEWERGAENFIDRLQARIKAADALLWKTARNPFGYHRSLDAPISSEHEGLLHEALEAGGSTADYQAGLRELFATGGSPELIGAIEDLAMGRLSEADFDKIPGATEWKVKTKEVAHKFGLEPPRQ